MQHNTFRTDRFIGHILGVGTASGVRVVVGVWSSSPLGSFADCMVAMPDGHRVLFAPSEAVAAYVASTYSFDQVRLVPVQADVDDDVVRVVAGDLQVSATLGRPTAIGRLLQLVPEKLSRSTLFAGLCDPIARVLLPGVRTVGSAGDGRREFYSAQQVRAVRAVTASLAGTDLGELRPVAPPPDFGFSSTPRTPALTTITTTVRVASPGRPGRPAPRDAAPADPKE